MTAAFTESAVEQAVLGCPDEGEAHCQKGGP